MKIRPWLTLLLAFAALFVAIPSARAAFPPVLGITMVTSTDPICFNGTSDTNPLAVTAGTTVYECYKITNFAQSGTTVSNVKVVDALVNVPGTATIPAGGTAIFVSAPFVVNTSVTHDGTVSGKGANGLTYTGGPDHATINIVNPAISVQKTASVNGTCPGTELVTVLFGTQVKYCYAVTNTGDTAINNVVVTDNGATIPVGSLAVGQTLTVSSTFNATVDTSTNAVATGNNAATNGLVTSPPDAAGVDVVTPGLKISTTVSTNGSCPGLEIVNVLAGTSLTWCYVVTNKGDTAVSNVTVADDVFGGVPGSIASLAPGQSGTLSRPDTSTLDTTLNAAASATATATGTGVHSDPDPAAVNVVGPHVDIDVTVSTNGVCPGVDVASVPAGTSARYCYLVTNVGDDQLESIDVVDQSNTVIGTIASMNPGGSQMLTGAPFVVQGDGQENATATATDQYGFGVFATDLAKIHALFPGLTVQKTVSLDGNCPGSELVTVLAGTGVTYCYAVANTGETTITGVIITDNGAVIPVGDLAPGGGAFASFPIVATADADTAATASGINAPTGLPFSSAPDDAAVDVNSPSLSIQKTASTDGSCPGSEIVTVLAGSSVTYCYTVTNNGDTTVTNVVVTDGGTSISIGDLPPGQSGSGSTTVVATSDIDTPATATGTVPATGTSVSSPPDGAAIDVVAPSLSIQKTVSTDGSCPGGESVTVLSGSPITYCYAVTNNGDTAVNGVSVFDNGVTVAIGNLGAGQTGNGSSSLTATANTSTLATAEGTAPATGTLVDSPPDGASVVIVNPALSIQKTVSADGSCPGSELVAVSSGATVTYCYAVTNTGDTAVGGVIVDDAGISVSIGDLGPGEAGNGSAQLVVTAPTTTAATASGTTIATGTPVSSPPDDASVQIVYHPALVVQKTVSTTGSCPGSELVTVLGGTQVTLCYAVTNTGDTAVTGITVSDNGQTISIGSLNAGATGSGTAVVTAVADSNTTAVASGTAPANGAAVSSPPDGAAIDVITPALSIATTVSTSGSCPGQEVVNVLKGTSVTWCYTVTNTGDTGVTAITVTDNQYGVVPGSIASLAPGASATLSVAGPANADLTVTASAAGTVPVTGSSVQSPQDPAVVNVVSPDIDIDVTVSVDGNCPGADSVTVAAETSVVYCYQITNNGDDTLTGVTVVDGNGNPIGTIGSLDAGTTTILSSAPVTVLGDATVSATASGTDAYGFPVNDSDTALVHALFAKLQIQKTVSLDGTCPGSELVTVLSGASVTYCYLVTNSGGTAVTGIVVTDAAKIVAAGNLAPGQSVVVSTSAAVTADENTDATAAGTNAGNNKPVVSAPDAAAVDVVHPALSIQKTASTDGTCPGSETVVVLTGTQVTYCYAVTNNGDTTIGDIVVKDAGVTISVGSLAPDAVGTVSAVVTAPANDINTAAVASGTDTATWTNVTSPPDGALIDVIHPALTLSTTVSLDGTCPGQEVANVLAGTGVTWCYVVTNSGDVAVSGVAITDNTYGALAGSASIGAGQSHTFSRPASPTADVNLSATAAGTDALLGSPVQSNPDPAVVNVVHPSIDIDVTVSTTGTCPGADSITVVSGTQVTDCYVVTNLGDDTLTNVVVKNAQNQVLTTIASIVAGGGYVFSSAAAPVSTDTTVTATASGVDQYGFPVSDTDTAIVHTIFANLHLVKTAPAKVNASGSGAAIAYTLAVSNLGLAPAVNAVVSDPLPAGSTYVSASSTTGSCSFAGGTVTCSLGTLAPGATATITVNTTTTQASGSVTNTASVSSQTPDSDSSDNTSTATTQIAGQGATRTLGFYANHPTFTAACLAANGGTINLGFVTLRDEKFDNEIDGLHGPDKDTRVETGIALAMGILNANVDHYTNNVKRSALEQARMQAGKQILTAICNSSYVGTPPPFNVAAAVQTLAGTDTAAMLSIGNTADAYNNSGDAVNLTVNPGPANSKYPWDDPTDSND